MIQEPIIIDLEEVKRKFKESHNLNEGISDAISWWTSTVLKATYGSNGIELPFRLAGSRSELSALISALGLERRYMADAQRFGLDNPATYRTRSVLDRAIRDFENKTGIPWPFKN